MAHSEIYDHRGEVIRRVHVEDPTDPWSSFAIETLQNVEPLLDFVRAMKDVQEQGAAWKLVGVMPVAEAEAMMRDGSFNDPAAVARYFNNSDHKRLRVWEGRL